MSDMYIIRISADASSDMFKETAETMVDAVGDWETDDNIMVVPEEIEPLDEDEARAYLEEMADALDVEVVEDESS